MTCIGSSLCVLMATDDLINDGERGLVAHVVSEVRPATSARLEAFHVERSQANFVFVQLVGHGAVCRLLLHWNISNVDSS
jgi:hypothetical protein